MKNKAAQGGSLSHCRRTTEPPIFDDWTVMALVAGLLLLLGAAAALDNGFRRPPLGFNVMAGSNVMESERKKDEEEGKGEHEEEEVLKKKKKKKVEEAEEEEGRNRWLLRHQGGRHVLDVLFPFLLFSLHSWNRLLLLLLLLLLSFVAFACFRPSIVFIKKRSK